jgi:hypothetical protein
MADLAADAVNLFGDFVVEPVEVGIVAGFFGFDEAVIDRLSVWNQILLWKKLVRLFREGKDLLRVRLVSLDAPLLDKSLAAEILDVVLHMRAVTAITEAREVVGWNYTKLAYLNESFDFWLAERIFASPMAVSRTEAVWTIYLSGSASVLTLNWRAFSGAAIERGPRGRAVET